ncbi:MAG: autorepressor SdpR family transcription factor [Candidatus Cloacimonadota bacterium]
MSDSFFKAIADANRRKILFLLKKNHSMTVTEIAAHFNLAVPTLSEHLKVLRNADLVFSEKKQQFVHYSLNTTVFEDIISWITDLIDKSEEDK